MAEGMLRHRFDEYLGKAEVGIYSILAAMLSVTAFAAIATAGNMLWDGFRHWTIAAQTLRVLNELLIVLMLVEILHTVRISIRFSCSRNRTFSGGWPDRFDSAHPGNKSGDGHAYEGRKLVERWSQYFSGRDDRTRLARVAGARFGALHYTHAALPACLERFRAGLNPRLGWPRGSPRAAPSE
jgi:hypothetical protein